MLTLHLAWDVPDDFLRDVVIHRRHVRVEQTHPEAHPVRVGQRSVDKLTRGRALVDRILQVGRVRRSTVDVGPTCEARTHGFFGSFGVVMIRVPVFSTVRVQMKERNSDLRVKARTLMSVGLRANNVFKTYTSLQESVSEVM